MIEFLNKNLTKYTANSDLFKQIEDDSDEKELQEYQSSLSSKMIEYFDNDVVTPNFITVSPMNNINFSKALYSGIDDKFDSAAYYLLNSLQTDLNKFLFDKDKLTILFKSNIGLTDLPYTLVLYLGGLHYWNKNYDGNSFTNSSYNNTPNLLDSDNKYKDFDISRNGKLAPSYGFKYKDETIEKKYTVGSQTFVGEMTELKNKTVYPSIKLMSDVNYRQSYNNSFIPKFGYGTYSSYMNKYYNFIVDKRGMINSGYDNSIKPFHIYGAEQGFVKSFKTYNTKSDKDINLMGHYTILKNNYGIQGFPTEDELVNSFKTASNLLIPETLGSLTFGYGDSSSLTEVYKIYCKLKTCYLYNAPNFSTKENILRTIEKLNYKVPQVMTSKGLTPITYDVDGTQCGIFSFLVYNSFFSKKPSFFTGTTISIKDIISSLGLDINFFDNLAGAGDSGTLLKFLMFFWDVEKQYISNMQDTFDVEKVNNDNFIVLLYPSHGGNSNLHKSFNKTDFKISPDRIVTMGSAGILRRESFNKVHINENLSVYGSNDGEFIDVNNAKNVQYLFNNLKTQDNKQENYLVYRSTIDILGSYFDNKSLIENATKVLWYDTSYDGKNLFIRDKVNENFQGELERQSYLTSRTYDQRPNVNLFNNIYKQEDGNLDLKFTNRVTTKELYEIIDLEKFDYFEQVFIDFISKYSDETDSLTKNNGNYSFQSLMKAVSTISENDIKQENIQLLNPNMEVLDFIYLLIGYSSYNYYFCSENKISALINAGLTQAQYTKNEESNGVFSEFLTQKLTVNNYSTIGSVSGFDTNESTQYHKFIFRPDVFLSKTKISDLTSENANIISYYAKKMIFGDLELPTYKNVDRNSLTRYITLYVNMNKNNSLNTKVNPDIVYKRFDYLFRFLDIEFNDYTFKVLHPYVNEMLSTQPLIGTDIADAQLEVNKYLLDVIQTLYNNSISALNLYLIDLKDKIAPKIDPSSPDSLYKKINVEDNFLDPKVKTYYNIKNIYDKYLSYQSNNVAPIAQKYGDVDLSVDTGEFSNTQGMLFYNFLHKDLSLDNTQSGFVGEYSTFDKNTPKHLAEYMQIVDRSNTDVGGKILIDIIKFSDQIKLDVITPAADNSELMTKSVYSVFDSLAATNGFILHPINSFVDRLSTLKSTEGHEKYAHTLFGIHTTTDRVDSNPAFILQWMDQSSSIDNKVNGLSTERSLTNSFTLDLTYDRKILNETEIPDDIKNGQVTSFVVDFTNKNQNMFKNIQLNTSEFANTEESINAVVNLGTNKGGEQNNAIVSGNLFRMMEQRSYTCQVETMGNVMIQPLTYFYLKNVPLFRGSYWITNVDHKISTNGMTTTFKGVRQPVISKVSNEKDVIKQIEKTLQEISKNGTTTTNQNYTLGIVTQDRNDGTFGTFYQQTSNKTQIASYNGLNILYAMIYSEFGSVTEIYKLFVALLYNRAKYWANQETKDVKPANVVKYMVDIALNLQANYGGYELRKYFDEKNPNNQASLQKLIEKYPLDQQNPICVLLNNIATCTNTSEVNKLLIPTTLQQQKLKIFTSDGKNFTSAGKAVFDTTNKLYPKINFKDVDLEKNYVNSWQAYNIIYMSNILTEPTTNLANSTIYDINVNDETRKEYEFLNPIATDTVTAGNTSNEFSYLGCFDRNKGIVFMGRTFSDKQVDNYLSTVASGTRLLPGKANVQTIKRNFTQSDIDYAYNFYLSNGFSNTAASALVGSFLQESGLNPKIINYNKKLPVNSENQTYAAGIAQWIGLGGRRSKMLMYAKNRGIIIPNYEEAVATYSNWPDSPFKQRGKQEDTFSVIQNAFSNMTLQVQLEYTLIELQSYKDFKIFKTTNDFNYATRWVYITYEGGDYSAGAALGNRVVYAQKIFNSQKLA